MTTQDKLRIINKNIHTTIRLKGTGMWESAYGVHRGTYLTKECAIDCTYDWLIDDLKSIIRFIETNS